MATLKSSSEQDVCKVLPLSQCQSLATDFFLDPVPLFLFLLSLLRDVPATFLLLSSQLRLTPAGLKTLNPKGETERMESISFLCLGL